MGEVYVMSMNKSRTTVYSRNRVIFKSFFANIRNYMILFSCFVLCVSVLFTFTSAYQMISVLQEVKIFNHTIGIGAIVFHAAILLGVLTILLTVFAIRHYEASRASDYEIFRTLGMPWGFMRILKALEYVGGMVFAFVVGMVLGNLFSILFRKCILHYFPEASIPGPDILTYIFTILGGALIFLFCIIFTEEVFVETRFLNGAEVMEKQPKKKRAKIFLLIGLILTLWQFQRYVKNGSEKIMTLFLFLAGISLIIYYGGSLLLDKLKKQEKNYMKHLLSRQRIFYQFWSNSLYLILFLGLWFMILFYYPVQLLTTETAMAGDEAYPYDFIWKMNRFDKDDHDFLENLVDNHQAKCTIVPMTIVTTPCMDIQAKKDVPKFFRQGQHIGIPASAYEQLTGKKVSLGKEELLVLLQQGKDKPGHPLDFYMDNSTYLHFGPANLAVEIRYFEDSFTNRYHVKEIRNENLIGIYGNGTNENVVVFSDEVFEELEKIDNVTDLFHYQTGREGSNSVMSVFDKGFIEAAGLRNRLVLMHVPDSEKAEIQKLFSERYDETEHELYNPRVGLYYNSDEARDEIVAERVLKNIINLMLYVIFFIIVLFLSFIKVYADQESILKEDMFYRTFGVKKKERESIWFHRLKMTFSLPFIAALFLGSLFIIMTLKTRMYSRMDIWMFAKDYIWILVGACLLQTAICIVAKQYLRSIIQSEESRKR